MQGAVVQVRIFHWLVFIRRRADVTSLVWCSISTYNNDKLGVAMVIPSVQDLEFWKQSNLGAFSPNWLWRVAESYVKLNTCFIYFFFLTVVKLSLVILMHLIKQCHWKSAAKHKTWSQFSWSVEEHTFLKKVLHYECLYLMNQNFN